MKWPANEKMNDLARNHTDGLYHRVNEMTKFTDPMCAIDEAEFLANAIGVRVSVLNNGQYMTVKETAKVSDKTKILETVMPS